MKKETEKLEPARCRYCGKVMPDFGEANGLNYAHTACSLKNKTEKSDCFRGKVVRKNYEKKP